MNDWQTILYWVSIVMLWILLGLNLWATLRNFRALKKQKANLEKAEQICREYETLRDTYIKLLDEQ